MTARRQFEERRILEDESLLKGTYKWSRAELHTELYEKSCRVVKQDGAFKDRDASTR